MTADSLDVYWENLVLSLIGETVDDGDEVCGCRVVDKSKKGSNNQKPMFRLEVWTRTGSDEVANQLKTRLGEALSDVDGAKGKGGPRALEFEFKKR